MMMIISIEGLGLSILILSFAIMMYSAITGKICCLKRVTQSMCGIMMIVGILISSHPLSLSVIEFMIFLLGLILCLIGMLGLIFMPELLDLMIRLTRIIPTEFTVEKICFRLIITGSINIILYDILGRLF